MKHYLKKMLGLVPLIAILALAIAGCPMSTGGGDGVGLVPTVPSSTPSGPSGGGQQTPPPSPPNFF